MDGEEHIHGQRSTRPEGPRVTTQWPSKQMGRVRNWGLPVRFARMLHEVQGVHTRTDRSSSERWLERSSRPDLDQDASLEPNLSRQLNATQRPP
jgi:hypothetical protein